MTQVHEIELSIAHAKRVVAQGDALMRLHNNPDFKAVILDGYLRDEAVRLVHVKADPSQQTPELQAACVRSIDAIGELATYFRNVERIAQMAERSIQDAEEAIAEIEAEESGVNY